MEESQNSVTYEGHSKYTWTSGSNSFECKVKQRETFTYLMCVITEKSDQQFCTHTYILCDVNCRCIPRTCGDVEPTRYICFGILLGLLVQ